MSAKDDEDQIIGHLDDDLFIIYVVARDPRFRNEPAYA